MVVLLSMSAARISIHAPLAGCDILLSSLVA